MILGFAQSVWNTQYLKEKKMKDEDDIPDTLQALMREAKSGNVQAERLLLKYIYNLQKMLRKYID